MSSGRASTVKPPSEPANGGDPAQIIAEAIPVLVDQLLASKPGRIRRDILGLCVAAASLSRSYEATGASFGLGAAG